MGDKEYQRLLPMLPCPFCKQPLKELIMGGFLGKIELSYVCDCEKFIESKLKARERYQ